MELEAENLWVHSANHDFYDKKISSNNIIFFLVKKKSKHICYFQKIIFGKSKIFIENQYKNFQKSRKKSRKNRDFFNFF